MKCLTLSCFALGLLLPTFVAGAEDAAGFKPIFNGENLDGWIGSDEFWRVEDGHVIGQTTKENATRGNTFLIWDEGQAGDFGLRFRYRIDSEWANSGVQVRSEHLGDYRVRGYQPDIATDDWITGIHYEEGGRGILARRGEKAVFGADGSKDVVRFAAEDELGRQIKRDDWNECYVVARGDTIVTKINGVKMHEIVDNSPQARRSGVIAFQLHQGPPMTIRFADIQLKEESAPPIRALLVTGGGWHDFEAQKTIIAEGVGERIHMEWTFDYEAGRRNDFEPTRFQDEDWIEPFDVVVYNIGISRMPVERQKDLTDRIAGAHRETGVPAIFIHNALHFGRQVDRWHEFTGLTSRRHTSNRPRTLRNLAPDHPIMRDFGETWKPVTVELYLVEAMSSNATALADCDDEEGRSHITYWTHQYGKAPVFGTTIGHDNHAMADPVYLDTLARGVLWATGKLDADGNPLPAYNRSLGER